MRIRRGTTCGVRGEAPPASRANVRLPRLAQSQRPTLPLKNHEHELVCYPKERVRAPLIDVKKQATTGHRTRNVRTFHATYSIRCGYHVCLLARRASRVCPGSEAI